MLYYNNVLYTRWVPKAPPGRETAHAHTHTGQKGDYTVGNPRRAQISQFELFELILLLKLYRQFPVEQFEATVSQSTIPSPLLTRHSVAWRTDGRTAGWTDGCVRPGARISQAPCHMLHVIHQSSYYAAFYMPYHVSYNIPWSTHVPRLILILESSLSLPCNSY